MRTIKTILSLLLLTHCCMAQPVLDDNSMPPIGFSAPLYVGTNISSAGGGGANADWDFSWQSAFDPVGWLDYIGIDGTEFQVDFLTCNLVARRRLGGDTIYTYYTDFGSYVEIYGENMGSSMPANYTQNKKTLFNFPMNYGDSLVDSWQRVGAQGKVKRYYDGWGKLKTFFTTYYNVARIKTVDSFQAGSTWTVSTSYTWYTIDKLLPIAHYEDASNQMTVLKAFPVSVQQINGNKASAAFAPNPFSDKTNLIVSKAEPGTKLVVTDAIGQIVMEKEISSAQTEIRRDNLTSGIYFYQLKSKSGISASGKLVIE
jgi:hypothetical protein